MLRFTCAAYSVKVFDISRFLHIPIIMETKLSILNPIAMVYNSGIPFMAQHQMTIVEEPSLIAVWMFIYFAVVESWNGPNDQAPLHAYSGSSDLTVLKLDALGTYQWHAFYGSNLSDDGISIVLDGIGSVYIVGSSSATWNGPDGQTPLIFNAGSDISVLKLDNLGEYHWHTFYGSNDTDYGSDIISDFASGLYIGSYSKSTWNGPDGQEPLHPYSGSADFTVLKLDNDGTYQWHTFYGSNYDDIGMNITLSSTGGIYLIGRSADAWEGPSGEAPLHSYSGDFDYCILMLQGNYLPPIADFIASPTEGIAPLDVVFTNLSSGDYTTSIWDFGDGITSVLTGLTHTYYIADTYTVSLSVTGLGGYI